MSSIRASRRTWVLVVEGVSDLHEGEAEQVESRPSARVGCGWIVSGQADAPDPVDGGWPRPGPARRVRVGVPRRTGTSPARPGPRAALRSAALRIDVVMATSVGYQYRARRLLYTAA